MNYSVRSHSFERLLELINGNFEGHVLITVTELPDYIKQLPTKQQQVINFFYRDGLTFREIATTFGVSWSRPSQIRDNAIKRLRKKASYKWNDKMMDEKNNKSYDD